MTAPRKPHYAQIYPAIQWIEVFYRDVQVGDIIANHATCTAVVTGPAPTEDWRSPVKRGETRYECGPGFSSKSRSTNSVIVGRTKVTP